MVLILYNFGYFNLIAVKLSCSRLLSGRQQRRNERDNVHARYDINI